MLYRLVKTIKRKRAKAEVLAKRAKVETVKFSYVLKVEDIHDKDKHWM